LIKHAHNLNKVNGRSEDSSKKVYNCVTNTCLSYKRVWDKGIVKTRFE